MVLLGIDWKEDIELTGHWEGMNQVLDRGFCLVYSTCYVLPWCYMAYRSLKISIILCRSWSVNLALKVRTAACHFKVEIGGECLQMALDSLIYSLAIGQVTLLRVR